MRTLLFVLLLVGTSAHAWGQFPTKFYIGAFYVGGDSEETWIEGPEYVRYLDSTYNGSMWVQTTHDDHHTLPKRRFDELQDLGLNLAGIQIEHRQPHYNSDLPYQINNALRGGYSTTAVDREIDVCLSSHGLTDACLSDRLLFHPESEGDFRDVSELNEEHYIKLKQPTLDNYPLEKSNLSRSIDSAGSMNCVWFGDTCTVSNLTFNRKRELSAHRTSIPSPSASETISGLYHVSIIMLADQFTAQPPPPDGTVVLQVTVRGADSLACENTGYATREITFEVPGSAFYEGSALRTDAFEVYLGKIVLQIDEVASHPSGILTLNDSTRGDWEDTDALQSHKLEMFTEIYHTGDWLTTTGVAADYDISIRSTTGADFYVDAVCLSSQRGLALFDPSSPGVLPTMANYQSDFESYLGEMTRFVNDGSPLERVTMITMPEQDPYRGLWRNANLVHALLVATRSSPTGDLTCMPYTAKGSWAWTYDYDGLVNFHKHLVSGYYSYSMGYKYPRWNMDSTETSYNEHLYFGYQSGNTLGRITDNIWRYRMYAHTRKEKQINSPWIPYVQNHHNSHTWRLDGANQPQSMDSWFDDDTLREPNAAELRLMSNIALEHGADGIMFYTYTSKCSDPAARLGTGYIPLWPQNQQQYNSDSASYHNWDSGAIGFLGLNNQPRIRDVHGENKWDSTRAFISESLRPMGERLRTMTWQSSKSWYDMSEYDLDTTVLSDPMGTSNLVKGVMTWRMGSAQDIFDDSLKTLVETAEFKGDNDSTFLFVLNGRTHKDGQRHVTVKLTHFASGDVGYQWKVTDLRNGDIYIVKPGAAIDRSNLENGFTFYLDRGAAALFKLEAMGDSTTEFDGCLDANIYVEKPAVLSTTTAQELRFNSGCGIYVDGTFRTVQDTYLGPCSELWLGVHARSGGEVYLNGTTIEEGSVNVGPLSKATLADSCFLDGSGNMLNNYAVLNNLGGTLSSTGTIATDGSRYLYQTAGTTYLAYDSVDNQSVNVEAIRTRGGVLYMKRVRLLDQYEGIDAQNYSNIYAGELGNFVSPMNKISVYNRCIQLWTGAACVFGLDIGGGSLAYNDNMLQIETCDNNGGIHAEADRYSHIYAVENFWKSCVTNPDSIPLVSDSVDCDPFLANNPVPFAPGAGQGALSKSTQATSTTSTGSSLATVLKKMASGDTTAARGMLGTLLTSNQAAKLPPYAYTLLSSMTALHTQSNVQSLLTAMDHRNDLQSKLILANLLRNKGQSGDAIRTLNSYGFTGSNTLNSRAVMLKAEIFGTDTAYSYAQGVAMVDSLRTMVATDSSLIGFIELYPRLFSRIRNSGSIVMPKDNTIQYAVDVPENFVLLGNYPNPFIDATSLTFRLPQSESVTLHVHNILGEKVLTASTAEYGRGTSSITLDTGHWAPGLYLYRLLVGEEVFTGKMMKAR